MNVIVNKCVYVCVHMSIYDPHHSYLYISYANAKCVFIHIYIYMCVCVCDMSV